MKECDQLAQNRHYTNQLKYSHQEDRDSTRGCGQQASLVAPVIDEAVAHYYPRWAYGYDEVFLFICHDSFASVVTRTAAFYEKVFTLLTEAGCQPQAGHAS